VRWGIIGVGAMGQHHVRVLLSRPDVSLVAACDVNSGALESLPAGVERFDDWRSLIANTQLDGASVILPHHLYPEVVGALLGRRTHVLKEKPFARNLDDALAMCQMASASGKQLVVAGQHKFKSSFLAAREAVGSLGAIFLARAQILYRSTPIAVDGRWSWRGQKRLSGGTALVDSGWHMLELLTLLRGLPARVTANIGGMRVSPGDFDVDEQVTLILDYPDGGIAVVVASFVTTPEEIRLTLYGTRASLDVDLRADDVRRIIDGVPTMLAHAGTVDPMNALYDQFFASCVTGVPAPGHWTEAIQLQRIVEAGYLSVARGGAPVTLDELPAEPTEGAHA
jgi:UDP-N-acetylglucosamine 3-dehydrogenase